MTKKEIKQNEVKVHVRKLFKESGKIVTDTEEVETIAVLPLDKDAPYATVSTDRKFTKGLPNYSSASASVFVSVPCLLEESQMEAAYAFASSFAEDKLAEKIAEMTGGK